MSSGGQALFRIKQVVDVLKQKLLCFLSGLVQVAFFLVLLVKPAQGSKREVFPHKIWPQCLLQGAILCALPAAAVQRKKICMGKAKLYQGSEMFTADGYLPAAVIIKGVFKV